MLWETVGDRMYVSTTTDPVSKQPQVLLRRVRVDRFNLPPDTPLLRDEVRLAQAWGNGDLLMALVCHHLMANPPLLQLELLHRRL